MRNYILREDGWPHPQPPHVQQSYRPLSWLAARVKGTPGHAFVPCQILNPPVTVAWSSITGRRIACAVTVGFWQRPKLGG